MQLTARLLVLVLSVVLGLSMLAVAAKDDFYNILGVSKSATKKEIKKAYREQSKKYHPDKNPGNKQAEDKFVRLAEAYEVLGDEEKRRVYDQFGEEGLKGQGQQFHNPFDIFSQFGGFGGGGFGQRAERRGPSISMMLDVTLEELFGGADVEVEINKQIICPICRGSGAKSADHVKTCNTCGGSGVRIVRQQIMPGFFQQVQTTCDACGGRGKVVHTKCAACDGAKVKRGSSQMTIQVERGMMDGQVITFEGEADQSPDHRAGDVKFTIRTQPHPLFTRRGDNLYMTQTVSLKEALLGFKKTFKHLDGKETAISRKAVTQPGFVQTVKGQGMPRHGFPSERGDLFVEYAVVFPPTLTAAQKKLIEQL
ncbi:hypothetical protein BC831DRAFT_440338 [Entophlyctis helioformis]|nr:hypothetical protein BC831DRAFT_440338 [Entophlyctis helioformis]